MFQEAKLCIFSAPRGYSKLFLRNTSQRCGFAAHAAWRHKMRCSVSCWRRGWSGWSAARRAQRSTQQWAATSRRQPARQLWEPRPSLQHVHVLYFKPSADRRQTTPDRPPADQGWCYTTQTLTFALTHTLVLSFSARFSSRVMEVNQRMKMKRKTLLIQNKN